MRFRTSDSGYMAILLSILCILLSACANQEDQTRAENPASVVESVHAIGGYEAHRVMGFAVYVAHDLAGHEEELDAHALTALENDLRDAVDALPAEALARLLKTKVFIELESEARESGFSGRGAVYHVSEEWLVAHDFIPEKTASVEIANVRDYLSWREHQPSMILHELAHAYSWIVGPEIPVLTSAYEQAVESGIYEQVGYVLAKNENDLRRAYALNNEQEYFAELTEAYFGRNDFFPFVRDDLRAFDPVGFSMIENVWQTP